MTRQVVLERRAKEALRNLPPQTKRAIKRGLAGLAEIRAPADRAPMVKRLDAPGTGEPVYRLRVGDHRCVFVVRPREVRIVHIFHRGDGYEWFDRLHLD